MNNIITVTKLLITTLISLFLVSCSTNNLVSIEAPIEQLQNLEDYDSDGVIEAREKCADTTLGAIIDNYGCGTKTPKVSPYEMNIKFAHNKYSISQSAYPKIQKLAALLEENKEILVLIEGHTSKVGEKEFNQKLSENRAKAVANVLVNEFHIEKQRVSSIGYSFEQLKEEGNTPEAHAINRRIIAKLKTTEYIDDMKWTIYTVNQEL